MTIKIPLIGDKPPGVPLYGDFGVSESSPNFYHKFECCGATGRTGPTFEQANAYYSTQTYYTGNTWVSDANSFTVVGGIQEWRVPIDATYQIKASAGRGGDGFTYFNDSNKGGRPANAAANVYLNRGDIIQIAVAQRGQDNEANLVCSGCAGSGSGATVLYNKTTSNLIMMLAGGAGASKYFETLTRAGSPTTYSKDANTGPYGKALIGYGTTTQACFFWKWWSYWCWL